MHFIIFHLFYPTKVYTWDRTADWRNTFHLRQVTFLRDFLDSLRPCLILMQAGNVSSATNLRSPGYSKSNSKSGGKNVNIIPSLSLSLGVAAPSLSLFLSSVASVDVKALIIPRTSSWTDMASLMFTRP